MAKPSAALLFPLLYISLLTLFVLVLLPLLSPRPPRPLAFLRATGLVDPSPPAPRIAYLISGSDGDGGRVLRLLHAVYHPGNLYLLYLDLRAPQRQRDALAAAVQAGAAFGAAGNVNVVGSPGYANGEGCTAIASVLRGAAIMLRQSKNWDWFVNMAASDYPLITQDDLLHALSFVPRDLNFIQHTSNVGWNDAQRAVSIVVDPGIYLTARRDIFYGSQRRPLPTSYKFFTGSSFTVLSRKFIEFSVLGWDNLPRTLLMYFSNMRSPQHGYFHTVACNSEKFRNTVVNSDLRFDPSDGRAQRGRPQSLNPAHLDAMIGSGAAFAGGFLPDDPLLDRIDAAVLRRGRGRVAPGGWCLGSDDRGRDPCQSWGDPRVLRPGPGAKRFETFLLRWVRDASVWSNSSCSRLY